VIGANTFNRRSRRSSRARSISILAGNTDSNPDTSPGGAGPGGVGGAGGVGGNGGAGGKRPVIDRITRITQAVTIDIALGRTETAKFTDSDETVGFGNAFRRKRRSRERRVPRRSSSRRLTQTTMVSRTPDDNCPEAVNPDQADLDGDGVGDACSERERQTVRMS
jgi:hypothetical protein